jgi:hypothetical protein
LTIAGPGADVVTVSGNRVSRVFEIAATFTVGISGLTVANGSAANDGGGILNTGTLTLTSSTINSNVACSGGGIYTSGALTITNSAVNGNVAFGYPGIGEGGGIYASGAVTITNSTVSGNSATSEYLSGCGGGIDTSGTVTITSSTISGNSAAGDIGGGILNGGTLTVTSSTISGNSTFRGGGIFNAGLLTVTSSTLTGNVAYYYPGSAGGGIYNEATLTVSDSTIAGNQCDYAGGGIYNDGRRQVRNTIIAGNTAPNYPDFTGDLGSLGHNIIGNTQGASGFDPTDLLNVDPLLGPLRDNGGPTQTMALRPGSQALNAGDPNQLGTTDERGVVRSGGVNIGAYQASASALLLTGPATFTAGVPFDIIVLVVDPFRQTAVGYTGTVHFVATNGAMADYTFTAADAGQHTFSNLVLRRAGTLTVTGTDTADASLTGSTTFTVTLAAADHLLFLQQPSDTVAGQTIGPAVMVAVVDQFGNIETGDNNDTVTLSLGTNPGGGTLSGTLTVTVVNGVATFSDLSIDQAGGGYTLHATVGGGLADIESNPFNVTM